MIWGGMIVQLTQCQIIWALWHVVLSLWTQPWSAEILRMWPLDNAHLVLSDPKYGHKMSSTPLHHLLFQVTLFQIFPIWLILSYSSLQQQKATPGAILSAKNRKLTSARPFHLENCHSTVISSFSYHSQETQETVVWENSSRSAEMSSDLFSCKVFINFAWKQNGTLKLKRV